MQSSAPTEGALLRRTTFNWVRLLTRLLLPSRLVACTRPPAPSCWRLEPWPLALIANWMFPLPGDTVTVPAPLLALIGNQLAASRVQTNKDRRMAAIPTSEVRLLVPQAGGILSVGAAGVMSIVGLVLLSAGIVVGLTRLDSADLDAAMTVTALIWAVYAAALVLRRETGLQGRRLAWSLVAGFSLVAFALPLTHFAS